MSTENHNYHQFTHMETIAIHGGQSPEPTTGAVMPPVSFSSTYIQESPGKHKGFEYTRSHNPTRYALERNIAALEGAYVGNDASHGGFAFASGMAAIGTALELLDAGDHLIAMDDLYGGTYRALSNVRMRTQGFDISYVDMVDSQTIEDAITDKTKMIWVETPTNPTLKIVDLDVIARIGQKHGILTVCDNTFASPILQRPLSHGIDIVMHSGTKYLGGHSDVVCGMLVTNSDDLVSRIRFLQNSIGSVLGPMDSYLALRGAKTLALRMERHCQNAQTIAEMLEKHPKVQRVTYPGLKSHPQYDIACKQMRFGNSNGQPAGGGMITIWLDGGLEESRAFLERVQLFSLAESLGGVESLIEHPAIMTHASIPAETRKKLGIDDNLCRLSVGIEHVEDLLDDLNGALG